MPERLFESENLTFNLNTLGTMPAQPVDEPTAETAQQETDVSSEPTALEGLPNAGEWEKWGKLLQERKEANNRLSSTLKKSEYEVESKFFEEFFSVNWGKTTGDRLNLFGAPLKKAITVLEFDPKKNPILGFITKPYVIQNLINTDKLNVETFKAIYNAVAKKLAAPSEFIHEKANEYNILYCPKLYDKSVKEIEEYLTLQKDVLSSASTDVQAKNKKVFFNIKSITASDLKTRVAEINNWAGELPVAATATLNSLELARLVNGIKSIDTVVINTTEQDTIVGKLNDKTDLYAALLYLNMSTDSQKAKQALADNKFSGIDYSKVVKALTSFAENKIMPKGKLSNDTADTLVDKILAKLATL